MIRILIDADACLAAVISVLAMFSMMGGKNAHLMAEYQAAQASAGIFREKGSGGSDGDHYGRCKSS